MKKLLISLLVCSTAQAAPWDLSIQQYDQFGTSLFNRLVPLPSGGGVDGVVVYDQAANLPKLATLSGCSLSSGVFTCTGSAPSWSSLTGTPPPVSTFSNDSGYLTGITSGQVTTALGFTPYNATNPNSYVNQAGARSSISLTTSGTSGAATYNSSTGVLNVPNYAPGTGTVTSITAGIGLSGGTITTSGTISMPNTGTAGTYTSSYTTDAQGRITAALNRSQSSAARSLNSGFQISSTRDAFVTYSVQTTVTASIGSGQDGDVFLDIASDSGFTTNLQTIAVGPCSQTYTLAIALQGVQKCPINVSGYVPASYYTRLRTVNNTGTPSYQYRYGQEVLL